VQDGRAVFTERERAKHVVFVIVSGRECLARLAAQCRGVWPEMRSATKTIAKAANITAHIDRGDPS
jgi:hypothetical protein